MKTSARLGSPRGPLRVMTILSEKCALQRDLAWKREYDVIVNIARQRRLWDHNSGRERRRFRERGNNRGDLCLVEGLAHGGQLFLEDE